MSTPIYGRDALRRLREQQAAAKEPERQPSLLEQIPADAPMDDATLTVWNGERFVAWDKWLATAPLIREEPPLKSAAKETLQQTPDLPEKSSTVQEGLFGEYR